MTNFYHGLHPKPEALDPMNEHNIKHWCVLSSWWNLLHWPRRSFTISDAAEGSNLTSINRPMVVPGGGAVSYERDAPVESKPWTGLGGHAARTFSLSSETEDSKLASMERWPQDLGVG